MSLNAARLMPLASVHEFSENEKDLSWVAKFVHKVEHL